jgi:hypothetical protein
MRTQKYEYRLIPLFPMSETAGFSYPEVSGRENEKIMDKSD